MGLRFWLWLPSVVLCFQGCVSQFYPSHPVPVHHYIAIGIEEYNILPTRMRHRRPRPGKIKWWQHGLPWEHRALHIQCVWDRGKRRSRLWLAWRMWDQGRPRPLPQWLALLLLACGDVEPGPTSNVWQSALATLRRGVAKPDTACLGPHDGRIRWASYNIEGPTVDWDRLMTIVRLLNVMRLDFVALKEAKPTFHNITSATTLTFPEWQMYYTPIWHSG